MAKITFHDCIENQYYKVIFSEKNVQIKRLVITIATLGNGITFCTSQNLTIEVHTGLVKKKDQNLSTILGKKRDLIRI